MPELAEVEFFRKRWEVAHGETVVLVQVRPPARIFRGLDAVELARALAGRRLLDSAARAKQMRFRFSGGGHLGIHLGMAGELETQPVGQGRDGHAHLILETAESALIFSDFRMFGRVQWHVGPEEPDWWAGLPPDVISRQFTRELVATFLHRRTKAPLKAILLMQERFPGIGNWMADEILWRARLRPDALGGELNAEQTTRLYRKTREVARDALREIAGMGTRKTMHSLEKNVPDHWLFNHRWKDGGTCPKTGQPLIRQQLGGRTTCWSPAWQREPFLERLS